MANSTRIEYLGNEKLCEGRIHSKGYKRRREGMGDVYGQREIKRGEGNGGR